MKTYEGNLSGKGKKIGIVVSRFNELVTQRLLGGALDQLKRHGVSENDVEVAWVPGAFEIPVVSLKMAKLKKYHALIALGCIIRGETDHYEQVAGAVSRGLENISVETGVPVIFGILTCENLEQAINRAGAKSGNKGSQAALAAIEMADLLKSLDA
ncbi:MAG TPA: 6,7-dimethyl-8-ribityllumazine synthase [Candidatus Omnitrophota bacterium]|nr:6,7-dimethyl-8-ribityllumazine synthase [Candidatus Omnitrophota bacterium]